MVNLASDNFDDAVFNQFCRYIHTHSGILVKENKKQHLSNRLRTRIKELGLDSYETYWKYLISNPETNDEIYHLFSAVSTNETYFQRGSLHYSILSKYVFPDILKSIENYRPIVIWSCGTSTGEEAYDLAMNSLDFEREQDCTVKILATDISKKALDFARHGEYADRRIDQLSEFQISEYFNVVLPSESSLTHAKKVLCVKDTLKNKVDFKFHNMVKDNFFEAIDVIFCRNVLIYFDKSTQDSIIQKFSQSLRVGGYLFLGPSETLNVNPVHLKPIRLPQGTIFQKSNL